MDISHNTELSDELDNNSDCSMYCNNIDELRSEVHQIRIEIKILKDMIEFLVHKMS